MVPDRFNMVDMDGVDILYSQGLEVPGLYNKLVESYSTCRYTMLYNWQFNNIPIAPSYVELSVTADEVIIQPGITVTQDDVLHIYSIEPEPVLSSLEVSENGTYLPPEGVDGFDSVEVDVQHVLQSLAVSENGVYTPPEGVYGFNQVTVAVQGGDASAVVFSNTPTTLIKGDTEKTGTIFFFYEGELGIWYCNGEALQIAAGVYSLMLAPPRIRTNYAESGFLLNWVFNPIDDFEIIFKMEASPAQYGNWPKLISTNTVANIALNWNFYSNRRVMNIRYNNYYSGDANVSYDSPYDYNDYYKITKTGALFRILKSVDLVNYVEAASWQASAVGQDAETESVKFLYFSGDTGRIDATFYSFKVTRNGVVIHNYVARENGLYDEVTQELIQQTGTGITAITSQQVISFIKEA